MSFLLTAGWNDASVSGSVRIVGGGTTIFANIVNGELRMGNNQRGVNLDSAHSYVMIFDAITHNGSPASINAIAIPACSDGTVNDLGAMTGGAHLIVKKH
jgi:hypothetical protein